MKPIALATLALATLAASQNAEAQRELPSQDELPCNALCRAYMGSHYRPSEPGPEAPPTPAAEAAIPLAPARPASVAGPVGKPRVAALPPARPRGMNDPAPSTAGVQVALPAPIVPDPELTPVVRGTDEAGPAPKAPVASATDLAVELPPDVGQVSFDAGAITATRDEASSTRDREDE